VSQKLIESSRLWIKLVLGLDMCLGILQMKGAEVIVSFFFILKGEGNTGKTPLIAIKHTWKSP